MDYTKEPHSDIPRTSFQTEGRFRVKRTRTYTGCWTCRSRGVKCDETRPFCRICLQSRLSCKGYHVKLVWTHEAKESRLPLERRSILTTADVHRPVLSTRELNRSLIELDAVEPFEIDTMLAGPFAVFLASPASEAAGTIDAEASIGLPTAALTEAPEPSSAYNVYTNGNAEEADAESEPESASIFTSTAIWSIKQKLAPHLTTYVAGATLEERSLLHYWVTYLSGLMTPTPRPDNPFRTIFIPLALATPSVSSGASMALLHAVYALSAFSRAQLCPSRARDHVLGSKHHQASLRHLRQSLQQNTPSPDKGQNEALLATIIAVLSMDAFNGNSSNWRAHLEQGRAWLSPQRHAVAAQSPNAAVLCQIFAGMEVLASSQDEMLSNRTVPLILADYDLSPGGLGSALSPWPEGTDTLDLQFGVTRQIIESIARTNVLASRGPQWPVSNEEAEALDQFIRRNDPDLLVADMNGMNGEDDELIRHHTAAFFCASLIHFERRVRKTRPSKLQRLVQRSLGHLESIRALETEKDWTVCGIFWPLFVTVCEAEDICNLRTRALILFSKGKLCGIRNITIGEEIVREVWSRRDDGDGSDVSWNSTMTDLGLDLLLA